MTTIAILDLLEEIREEIDGFVDVKDGEDGRPLPNWAMALQGRVDEAIEKLEMSGVVA